MARGDSKIDIRNVIRAHRQTYVDASTDERLLPDFLLIDGVPIVVFVACFLLDVRLNRSTAIALLTVTGLLSALLFGVMLQVADRAMTWAESNPSPGPATSARAIFLRELAANAGYASAVCILAAITYLACSIPSEWATRLEWPIRLASAFGIAIGAHLILVILMVMKRVFALTESELNRARTEGDRPFTSSSQRRAS